ncbi:MAG: exodeoxyribonuclease VII small subunit [Halioglobus sp.]|nr:exodeoxyribonuclease VII small subunit [Halioglobus sp.]
MKSIETLLEKLDNSDTPLDQSLLAFEEGIQLIRMAQKQLSEAEQKVQLLVEQDGAPTSTDMNLDESAE